MVTSQGRAPPIFLEVLSKTLEDTLSDLIPFVCMQEHCTIKGEIEGKHIIVVTFDGTTRLSETLAIVLYFVTEDFEIKQRLIRLQLLKKATQGKK